MIDRLFKRDIAETKPFRIQVVDDETGRGVPLVELTTVNNIRYFTDSNGIVAFDEPGLMNQSVFFHVQSHGYEFPKDGFAEVSRKGLGGRKPGQARPRSRSSVSTWRTGCIA